MNFFSMFKATKKQIATTLERIGAAAHASCGPECYYVTKDDNAPLWSDAQVRTLADAWRIEHEKLRTQLQLARHTANEEGLAAAEKASRVEMQMMADEIDTANVTIGSLQKTVADLSEQLHMAETARIKLDLALRRSNDDLRAALERNIGLRAMQKALPKKKGKSK